MSKIPFWSFYQILLLRLAQIFARPYRGRGRKDLQAMRELIGPPKPLSKAGRALDTLTATLKYLTHMTSEEEKGIKCVADKILDFLKEFSTLR